MQYAFEALTHDGRTVQDRIEAGSEREAVDALRGRGLMVTRLRGAAEPEPAGAARGLRSTVRTADLVLFTRQMRMLLEAGAGVVPALEAIEQQTTRPAMRRMIRRIREHVETGGTLSEALAEHPQVFRPVFCSMVSSGEATGMLAESFARLSELAQRQQRAARAVLGAMIYPCLLAVMCVGAVATLMLFVVPRFRELVTNLRAPVPFYTQMLFEASQALREHWYIAATFPLVLLAGALLLLRTTTVRAQLARLLPRIPLAGRIYTRVILARVLRIWAAMLRCHVPLLETIRHSRAATHSALLLGTLNVLEQRVAAGGRVGRALAECGWVEPVVASAIATGEENGKLADAVEFVSSWVDEDNDQLIATVTRLVEPLMLALMGLIVGTVALALFLPLFDMATVAR